MSKPSALYCTYVHTHLQTYRWDEELLLYSLIEVSTNESLKCSVFLFDEKSMTDTIECVRGAAKDSMKAATISY